MSETKLPTAADAELVLKLYDLRREATMRRARQFLTSEFWPKTAEEILAVVRDFGSERNQWFRQVISYWEMANAFANRGVVNLDIYLDGAGEAIFLFAKFKPFLAEIRSQASASFLAQTEKLILSSQRAQDSLATIEKNLEARTRTAKA
jgi:hypothetical protein